MWGGQTCDEKAWHPSELAPVATTRPGRWCVFSEDKMRSAMSDTPESSGESLATQCSATSTWRNKGSGQEPTMPTCGGTAGQEGQSGQGGKREQAGSPNMSKGAGNSVGRPQVTHWCAFRRKEAGRLLLSSAAAYAKARASRALAATRRRWLRLHCDAVSGCCA